MSEEPQTTRGRPKIEDRERVLDIAMDAYWQEGFAAVSLNDICRRAQISKPRLYREFGGEDGLIEAVIENYERNVLMSAKHLLLAELSLSEKLTKLTEFLSRDPKLDHGCLYARALEFRPRLGPRGAEQTLRTDQAMQTLYEEAIQLAHDRGELPADLGVPEAARYVLAQVNNAMAMKARQDPPDMIASVLRLAFSVLLQPSGQGLS